MREGANWPAQPLTSPLIISISTPRPSSTQDKLPTPFGLVRSGVAPDHADTKNVTNQFDRVLGDERVRFWGGVRIAEECGDGAAPPPSHLSVPDLRRAYSAVVLAHGAEGDARLAGIPGGAAAASFSSTSTPPLRGVLSARDFVLWVNGHPERAGLGLDLSKVKRRERERERKGGLGGERHLSTTPRRVLPDGAWERDAAF